MQPIDMMVCICDIRWSRVNHSWVAGLFVVFSQRWDTLSQPFWHKAHFWKPLFILKEKGPLSLAKWPGEAAVWPNNTL